MDDEKVDGSHEDYICLVEFEAFYRLGQQAVNFSFRIFSFIKVRMVLCASSS